MVLYPGSSGKIFHIPRVAFKATGKHPDVQRGHQQSKPPTPVYFKGNVRDPRDASLWTLHRILAVHLEVDTTSVSQVTVQVVSGSPG